MKVDLKGVDAKGLKGLDVKDEDGNRVEFDDKNGLKVTGDDEERDRPYRGPDWFFAIVWFVYNLVFLQRMSATPGKRLMKLKVISMNGGPLDKRQRLTRAAMSLVSGYAGGLGGAAAPRVA